MTKQAFAPTEVSEQPFAKGFSSPALSAQMWRDMPRTGGRNPADLPATLNLETAQLYGGQPAEASPDQVRAALRNATSINFTSPAQDAKSGQQPDFILGEDGKLKANPLKTTPSKDGSITIEIQSKNKTETDAKKLADQLQKSTIKDLINYFKNSHPPGTKLPQDWLDQLNKEPDLPPPVTPLDTPAPAPEQPSPPGQRQAQPASDAPARQSGGPGGTVGGPGAGGGDGQGAGYNPGPTYRGPDGGRTASSGASPNADQQTVLNNVKTVIEVAKEKGIDPTLAVATMLVESGGDNKAVGDGGHSIGLFQLNDNGEGAGMSVAQREDPRLNAETALSVFAQNENAVRDINRDGKISGGDLASQSQRPADMPGYVAKVDASMDEARQLIAQAEKQPSGQSAAGSVPTNLAWTAADESLITSPYGNRTNPITGSGTEFHSGLDIAKANGSPVRAATDGTVVFAGWSDSGSGNTVIIDNGNGIETKYFHLSAIDVQKGQGVKTGQDIAKEGSTGASTGPHLMLEVVDNGKTVDPLPYLRDYKIANPLA